MKRLICLLLLIFLLTGCSGNVNVTECDVTMEQIIEAYEAEEYIIWSETYEEQDESGCAAYVQANHINGEYVLFTFFSTYEDAKAYADDQVASGGLFSDDDTPTVQFEVYGHICVEYIEDVYCQPFLSLLE